MRRPSAATVTLSLLLVSASVVSQVVEDVTEIGPDTRIVYGSIQVFKNGKLLKWRFGNLFHLMFLHEDSNNVVAYKLSGTEDGAYFIALQPGRYSRLGYHWNDSTGFVLTDEINGEFVVPETGPDIYIGSMEVHFDKDEGRWFDLDDRFDRLSALFDQQFPERKGTSVKKLLERSRQLGDFAYALDSCDPYWGIECVKRWRGAVPLTPSSNVDGEYFNEVRFLRPKFSWEPSPREDISYDFALYKAAPYYLGFRFGNQGYMRGSLVDYQEDIKEPQWTAEHSLERDTSYYWSVRYRDGDTVSTWSSQRGSVWFRFRIP